MERLVRHFQEELETLKERLLAMGGLAEERVRVAVRGVAEREAGLVQAVLTGDEPINDLHITARAPRTVCSCGAGGRCVTQRGIVSSMSGVCWIGEQTMIMTNRWNRIIYRLWAPIYDASVDRLIIPGRKRALALLDLHAGDRLLIVGIGTGADLPLLPAEVEVTGIDISPHMLAKARLKLDHCPASVMLIEGDAQSLPVQPASFEAVILNLILSVVPDGSACLRAAVDTLRPGGRAVIFDKFVPEGRRVSFPRKILSIYLWNGFRHPSQVYEILAAVVILFIVYKRPLGQPGDGINFLMWVALSSAARIFLEAFRGDSVIWPGSFRAAQVVGLIILAITLYVMRIWARAQEADVNQQEITEKGIL